MVLVVHLIVTEKVSGEEEAFIKLNRDSTKVAGFHRMLEMTDSVAGTILIDEGRGCWIE